MTRQLVDDVGAAPIVNLANHDLAFNGGDYRAGRGGWGQQWYGPNGTGVTSYAAGLGPNGCIVARKVWTATPSHGLDVGRTFNFVAQTFKAGATYTFAMTVAASWATGHCLFVTWRDGNGAAIGSTVLLSGTRARYAAAANEQVRLVATAVAPAGVSHATLIGGPYPSYVNGAVMGIPTIGDVFDAWLPSAHEGVTDGEYANASFAGWQANGDTGVGFPYVLGRAIGGLPYLLAEGASGSIPLPTLSAFQGRTMAQVYRADGSMSSYYTSTMAMGNNNAPSPGSFRHQTGPNGNDWTGTRVDLAGTGSVNANVGVRGGRSPGLHSISLRLNNGLTTASARVDGGAVNSTALTPGSGFTTSPPTLLYSSPPELTPVATVFIPAYLTDAQDAELHRWLINHYAVRAFTNAASDAQLDFLTLG